MRYKFLVRSIIVVSAFGAMVLSLSGCASNSSPNVAQTRSDYANEPAVKEMKAHAKAFKADPQADAQAVAMVENNPHMPPGVKASVEAQLHSQMHQNQPQ